VYAPYAKGKVKKKSFRKSVMLHDIFIIKRASFFQLDLNSTFLLNSPSLHTKLRLLWRIENDSDLEKEIKPKQKLDSRNDSVALYILN